MLNSLSVVVGVVIGVVVPDDKLSASISSSTVLGRLDGTCRRLDRVLALPNRLLAEPVLKLPLITLEMLC